MMTVRVCLPVSLVAVWIAVATVSEAAEGRSSFRAAHHATENYVRLVFEWPDAVAHAVRVADGKLIVSFDRPFEADLSQRAIAGLAGYVASARLMNLRRSAEFSLANRIDVKAFTIRDRTFRVVVDLRQLNDRASPQRARDVVSIRTAAGSVRGERGHLPVDGNVVAGASEQLAVRTAVAMTTSGSTTQLAQSNTGDEGSPLPCDINHIQDITRKYKEIQKVPSKFAGKNDAEFNYCAAASSRLDRAIINLRAGIVAVGEKIGAEKCIDNKLNGTTVYWDKLVEISRNILSAIAKKNDSGVEQNKKLWERLFMRGEMNISKDLTNITEAITNLQKSTVDSGKSDGTCFDVLKENVNKYKSGKRPASSASESQCRAMVVDIFDTQVPLLRRLESEAQFQGFICERIDDTLNESPARQVLIDKSADRTQLLSLVNLQSEFVVDPHPTSGLAASAVTGTDINGQQQHGFGLEVGLPYLMGGWLGGTPYKTFSQDGGYFQSDDSWSVVPSRSTLGGLIDRMVLSAALAKGFGDNNEAFRLLLGLRTSVFKEHIERGQLILRECLRRRVSRELLAEKKELKDGQDALRPSIVKFANQFWSTCADEASRLSVARNSWDIGLATAYTTPASTSDLRKFEHGGFGLWSSYALTFGIEGDRWDGVLNSSLTSFLLEDLPATFRYPKLTVHARYWKNESVPDRIVKGAIFERDTLGGGVRAEWGGPLAVVSGALGYFREDNKDTRPDDDYWRWQLGLGLRLDSSQWLSIKAGQAVGRKNTDGVAFTAGFSYSFDQASPFGFFGR